MPSTHIYSGTTTRLAGELNNLVATARRLRYDAPELKAIMDQIASGGDWLALATEFGYSTAADAETAYNLIGSLVVELQAAPFLNQVVSRMG